MHCRADATQATILGGPKTIELWPLRPTGVPACVAEYRLFGLVGRRVCDGTMNSSHLCLLNNNGTLKRSESFQSFLAVVFYQTNVALGASPPSRSRCVLFIHFFAFQPFGVLFVNTGANFSRPYRPASPIAATLSRANNIVTNYAHAWKVTDCTIVGARPLNQSHITAWC